jgi:nicotinate phosphoribosyltransferase
VIDFGLRRAQGVDGGLSASRAAYVGGCAGTSNVLAGRLFGIPVRGTHAHSWVMSFPTEQEAFDAYARAQPNNCVLLVDTYDSLEGVRRAVETGRRLRERGHELAGIRLDSGDLAYLSLEARKILDDGGFPDAVIVASNDLDEQVIASLKEQGAAIDVWGVGTRLVTGGDDPALGGVYKLAAVREPGGVWQPRVKVSEQAIKRTLPGIQQVRRFETDAGFLADVIYDEEQGLPAEPILVDPLDATRRRRIAAGTRGVDLLEPTLRSGRVCFSPPPLSEVRERVARQLERLHPGIKRFVNPHEYTVGLSLELHDLTVGLTMASPQP